jgi:hypothetical protein
MYNVDSANVGPFVASVLHGGLYREIVQQLLSGYIGYDVLVSHPASNRLLLLEFWLSEAAFSAAEQRPEKKVLASYLGRLATSCTDLGTFGFLSSRNLGIDSVPESRTALVHGMVGFSHDEPMA